MERPSGFVGIVETFGDLSPYIADDGIIDEKEKLEFLVDIKMPFHLVYAYDRSIIIKKMTCHKLMAPIFLEVLYSIAENKLDIYFTEFGGCWNYRPKVGSPKLSTHCWGIAIDGNPRTNQYGTKGDMNKDIVEIFKSYGFIWGGYWKKPDPMHFQFASNY
jgi:hypothetical protein